jgi:hypothetical protein
MNDYKLETTSNNKIQSFYNNNPKLNFEQMNLLFIELFEKSIDQQSADPVSSNFKQQLTNFMSIYKYEIGEDVLEKILNKINPTSEIIKNVDEQICGSFILKRHNKSDILIESKECDTNINNNITDFFIETIKKQNTCGIFISQHSGILNKLNCQIEIYNDNIVVYVQYCKYDQEKIKNAIEIIDNLYDKLKQIKKDNIYLIDKETLNEINSEYLLFQTQRNNITSLIQEYNSSIIKQIENINFNCLNKYLCSKIDSNKVVGIYKCNICNIYTSNKLKGISAHKRGCKNKCKLESN